MRKKISKKLTMLVISGFATTIAAGTAKADPTRLHDEWVSCPDPKKNPFPEYALANSIHSCAVYTYGQPSHGGGGRYTS